LITQIFDEEYKFSNIHERKMTKLLVVPFSFICLRSKDSIPDFIPSTSDPLPRSQFKFGHPYKANETIMSHDQVVMTIKVKRKADPVLYLHTTP
jgi:hypothetical protein